MKKLLGIIAVTVILVSMVGCNIENNYTIDSFETMNDTEKSMSYKEFQGEKEYKLNVKSGGATVFVDVVSKAGSLDASIMNESDKTDIIYEGKDIQTGSFSVNIKDEGTYLICLSAEHHSGSYSFTVTDIGENTEQDTTISAITTEKNWTVEEIKSMFMKANQNAAYNYTIVDAVVIPDFAYSRIGAVLYVDNENKSSNVAFLDADGYYQASGVYANLYTDSEFTYCGDGTVTFQLETETGTVYTYKLSISIDGSNVNFIASDDLENTNIDMPILDEINQNVQVGTTGAYMTAVQEAAKMLDWGTGTGLDTQEIREATTAWLMNKGNDEQVAFAEKLRQVDDAYHKLLGSDAETLMESAGCESDSYPWSNTLVEPIEAVMDAVGLRPYEENDAKTEEWKVDFENSLMENYQVTVDSKTGDYHG